VIPVCDESRAHKDRLSATRQTRSLCRLYS
jgi:hypothetical protein